MHGDIDSPHNAVITKDDYEIYPKKNELFSIALRGDLVSKTFLFLGFSFEDPNLNYILSRIRILLDGHTKEHYCIFKRVNKKDFKSNEQFIRTEIKQNLRVEDLKRYGIQTILIDDYPEITNILSEIEYCYRLSTIFISGSAHEYNPWGKIKSLNFIRNLSKEISSNNYKIVSGFGKGIGAEVVNGTLDYIFSTNYRHIEDYLLLRPFPHLISDPDERKFKWSKYRKEMISSSGISLFIFGNKLIKDDKGTAQVIQADGMREEYEISKENKNKLIPIGITGYISEEFWNEVMNNFNTLYQNHPQLKTEFQELNNKSLEPDRLIEIIIKIILEIKK
jgi:hypothetical protein